jgi:hypothetical protein
LDGSKVVYAGTEGAGAPTNPAGGRVFVTQDASTTLMTDVTGDINPSQYPISAIALDPADQSGRTAFVTVMGFGVEVGHVFKTTDAGTTWTNFSGSTDALPDTRLRDVSLCGHFCLRTHDLADRSGVLFLAGSNQWRSKWTANGCPHD